MSTSDRNARSQSQPLQDLFALRGFPSAVAGLATDIQGAPNNADDDNVMQEFFLPVTGFCSFYPEELMVINHPAFQRLGSINQLGQAHLVYRGATHKRIEHVLGTVAVAQRICESINDNQTKLINTQKKRGGDTSIPALLTYAEQRFIRLSALLHDIGHLAAGHTMEDELGLLDKHDKDARLTCVFSRTTWNGRAEPSLASVIDGAFSRFVPSSLAGHLSPSDIARLIIRKKPKSNDPYRAKLDLLLSSGDIRFYVAQNVVGNTICADLLDYLYRDWYHIGRIRSFEDRLFQYMGIARGSTDGQRARQQTPHPEDQFVIRLSEGKRVRSDAVTQILSLLEWRYELAEAVLFHRTKVSASSMLGRALYELWEADDKEDLVRCIIEYGDDQILIYATAVAAEKNNAAAKYVLERLRARKLYVELASFGGSSILDKKKKKLAERFGESGGDQAYLNRITVARRIEADCMLPAGSITIACTEVKPKLADVNIEYDGDVKTFREHATGKSEDADHPNPDILSGGHLSAQILRFSQMWRLRFFIDQEVFDGLDAEIKEILTGLITEVITSTSADYNTIFRRCEGLAQKFYKKKRDLQLANNLSFNEDITVEVAGRMTSGVAGGWPTYPNGAPCFGTFIRRHDV